MPRHRGNVSDKIDRNLLHQYLWKHRDRNNFSSFKTGELAEDLGVTIYAMSAIMKQMCDAGLLTKYGNSKYVVTEPSIAAWSTEADKSAQGSMF